MDKAVKEKWVEALLSGKYEQARKQLRLNGRYCCLGVLCDITAGVEWDCATALYKGYASDGMLPHVLREEMNLSWTITDTLAEMNDTGSSFAEIADYIRKNL